MATYTDKLFKLRNGRWEDLLSDEVNRDVASRFAGRSVACVDRTVSGQGVGQPLSARSSVALLEEHRICLLHGNALDVIFLALAQEDDGGHRGAGDRKSVV